MIVTLDFETRSAADLKRVGAWAYSEHPTTEVICLCWKLGGGPTVYEWWPGMYDCDECPADLADAIARGDLFEAHNVAFEISIWKNVMVKRFGWPDVPLRQWRDSMATASYFALPPSLDRLCAALGLPGKDPEGVRLITKYSKLHLKTAKTEIPDDDFFKFVDYCRRDVEIEHAASEIMGDLPDAEVEEFLRELEANFRGLYLDVAGIERATEVVDKRSAELEEEFVALTGVRPSQRDKCMAWFEANGLLLENMTADYLENLLEEGDVPAGAVRRALQIRLEINKASTKKLDAMARQCGSDGRARFQTRYHGAATGRNTGSGFQPLNLNRGFDKIEMPDGSEWKPTPEQLMADIRHGDPAWLDFVYGDAMDAVAKAARHFIMAAPGHRIIAGDFVSIEAVILACLAGEEWKIQVFRNKEPVYERTADKIYGYPPGTVTKATHPNERQDGKRCLGAGTRVLTDSGWKPITKVVEQDLLWDGVEWVRHHGLLYQGRRLVIEWAGVEITPDHGILCGNMWLPAATVTSSGEFRRLAMETGSASLPWWALNAVLPVGSSAYGLGALAARASIWWRRATYETAALLGARTARETLPPDGVRTSSDTLISAPTIRTDDGFVIAFPLASRAASPTATRTMALAASASTRRGPAERRGAALSSLISSDSPDGIIRRWRLIASTWIKATSRAIYALPHALSRRRTSGLWPNSKLGSLSLRPVYDLANAGPRRRFTILTDDGPAIVHNCELAFGYQGALNAWLKFDPRPIHSDEAIIGFCKSWRREHPATTAFWRNLEDAAVEAVQSGEETTVLPSGIRFKVVDQWLTMQLPDGKRLWYFDPQLRMGMPKWHDPVTREECASGACNCRPQLKLTYMAQKEGQWKRVSTYGGKLAENATQAVSRQILVEAKKRLVAAGYPLILTVYDEIVAEVPDGFGSKEEFEELMMQPVSWAPGWPISVDVTEGTRYSK